MAQPFIPYRPRPEDYWHGIILFGRNVATYKFALGRALLDLRPTSGQLITLQELAAPFASHLCAHLQLAEKQAGRRAFLNALHIEAHAALIHEWEPIEVAQALF